MKETNRNKKFLGIFAVLLCALMLISVCTACSSSAPNAVIESSAGASSAVNSIVDEKTQSNVADNNAGKNPVKEELAYIKSFDLKSGLVTYDPIEWVMKEDKERVKELGLDAEDDFPNGFYVYNPSEQLESLKLSKNFEIYIILWNNVGVAVEDKLTNKDGLDKRLKETYASAYPYELTIKDGEIIKIKERYVP